MSERPPSVNLEVKAVDPDPAATERACRELGARNAGVLAQRDTYFAVSSGRLKLREHVETGAAELISYARPDRDGTRASRYRRVPVPDPVELRAALADALGVVTVVEKRRRLYLFENVRIHLDDVAGLGRFVELESVLASPDGVETAQERDALARVRTALGLDARATVAGSYADLATTPEG